MVNKKEISIKTIEDIVNKVSIEDNVMKMFWWMVKSNDKECEHKFVNNLCIFCQKRYNKKDFE